MEEETMIEFEQTAPYRMYGKRLIAEYALDGTFVRVHGSIRKAGEANNISVQAVTACCNGKTLICIKANKIFLDVDASIEERLKLIEQAVLTPPLSRGKIPIREYSTDGKLFKVWYGVLSIAEAFQIPYKTVQKHLEGSPEPIKDRFFLTGEEKISDRLTAYLKWKQERARKEKEDAERKSLVKCAEEVLQIDVYTSGGEFLKTCKNSSEVSKIYGVSQIDVNNHMRGKALVTRGLMFLPYGEDVKERLKKVKNRKTWKNNL